MEATTSVLGVLREFLDRVPLWVRTYTAEKESARYLAEVRKMARKILCKHPYRLEEEEARVKTPGKETAKPYVKEFPGQAEGDQGEYLVLRAEPLRRAGLLRPSLWPFGRRG